MKRRKKTKKRRISYRKILRCYIKHVIFNQGTDFLWGGRLMGGSVVAGLEAWEEKVLLGISWDIIGKHISPDM